MWCQSVINFYIMRIFYRVFSQRATTNSSPPSLSLQASLFSFFIHQGRAGEVDGLFKVIPAAWLDQNSIHCTESTVKPRRSMARTSLVLKWLITRCGTI